GATLVEHGSDFTEAFDYAKVLAKEEGLTMMPSFDRLLVAGVATYALELLRGVADLDTVYVPIGMGSGLCGMLAVRDALGLKTRIVGVVADGAPGFALSYAAQRPISANVADTIADGLAVRTPDARTASLKLLQTVLVKHRSIDDALDAAARGLEPRDRAFVHMLTATTLRRIGQIDAVLQQFVAKIPPDPVLDLLRLGTAQLLFL